MKFRYARHTDDIDALVDFYTKMVGLKVLGHFEDHDNYDGVFLGFENVDWHIEFTTSQDQADHKTDEDDALVFYLSSQEEMNVILDRVKKSSCPTRKSKNPYWRKHGLELVDPDGFSVIFTMKEIRLKEELISPFFKNQNILHWGDVLRFVRHLPYGRNSNRMDVQLVEKEQKGSCSSKHAYLKYIADLHQIPHVKLMLVIYKMSELNTPGLGSILSDNQLKYIPEAHCVIEVNGIPLDLTNPQSNVEKIQNDILETIEIEPAQVSTFKVNYHKDYLKKWIRERDITLSFEELWSVRENCIQALSQ